MTASAEKRIPESTIQEVRDRIDIVELVSEYVPLHRKGANWQGLCPFHSEKSPSFNVSPARQSYHCFGCGVGGTGIDFVMRHEGISFPEAVRKVAARVGVYVDEKTERPAPKPLAPPAERRDDWRPVEAAEPAHLWRQKAGKFVAWAHERLLEDPEQLAYLEGRGIPRDAVIEYRLGWNPGERGKNALFRDRAAWGLPEKVVDGKKKRLWIPRGIVIPAFREGALQKVRIRRPKEDREKITIGYYALEGGGDDVPVYGESERAFVVTEADLCGIAVAWACRGLAGAVPLASCSVKPKTWAATALERALCVLVATDYDPGTDDQGRYKNPGGRAARWWAEHYPRAERWPVPLGKDPGDYVGDHGGDLRAWVAAALAQFAPALTVASPESRVPGPESTVQTNAESESDFAPREEGAASPVTRHASPPLPNHAVGETLSGHPYAVAYRAEDVETLRAAYPERVVFSPDEITALKGMGREEAEKVLLAKQLFSGTVIETRPYHGDPREQKVIKFDPSRQRAGRR